MEHSTTVLKTGFVTHDIRRFVLEKPEGFEWKPGQGVEIAIDREGWREEARPFTPTGLAEERVLELLIKRYRERDGVTDRLHGLGPGERLLMSEPFGTILHRGRGTFLAGGAGVTPFLAILRRLERDGELDGHGLIFSNRSAADVPCERELRHLLGDRCHLTLTGEDAPGYGHGRIDRDLLAAKIDDFDQRFYLCGPPRFVEDLKGALVGLGASPDALVFEE